MKPFDANGAFRPSVNGGEVRRLALRGASVTVFSGGLGLAVQVIATVILVRLLTPADFGVVTMVTTFSLLLLNFGLNGFTEAILQWQEIDRYLVSNLFWINVGAGLVLGIGFAAAGSLMAWFYHNPLVARVAAGISVTIFITSTSVQHLALLKRAMRFSTTSANEIFSRGVALAISIVLAWKGWGYWALVLGAVAQALVQSSGAWLLCRWLPSLPRRVPGTASMVKFAIHVYGRFTVNYFARNVDNLLVGWRFGAIQLGFYKKAYDLFALSVGQLTAPLTNVAVAALSRFEPRSPKYRQNLLGAMSLLAFVGMGLSAEFTIVGKDLIYVLLGPKWGPAGQIFTFFAPGIGMMLIYYTHSWIHLSIGRADRWFRWGLVEVGTTFLLFIIALPWGPKGVAVAWASSFWILTIPSLWYAGQPIDFGVRPVFANIWKFVVAALLAGGATKVVGWGIPYLSVTSGSLEGMVAGIVRVSMLFATLYLGAVILLYRGYAPLYQIVNLAKELMSLRKYSALALEVIATPTADQPVTVVSKRTRSQPLVSILIPAFNSEEWIADAINSAIGQTWDRKEIIVVDDGSTDRTLAIARQFESDWIRVVTQENQGAAAARNKAFSLSRGDYIQWLDADDLLAPDKIAKQVEVLDQCQSKKTILSSSFGRFKYRWDRAEFTPTALWCDLSPTEWMVRKLAQNAYMQTATWLVSRELTEDAGPWDTSLLGDDDGEYFCRVLLASDGARFVSDSKVYYRSPWVGTLSYIGRSDRKLNAHWRSMRLHIDYLRSLEDSERVRAACLAYLQRCFIYFYPEKPELSSQLEQLAKDLGGQLHPPHLSWKYAWIRAAFGWGPAKRCQTLLPEVKWLVKKSWDKALFRLRGRFLSNEL